MQKHFLQTKNWKAIGKVFSLSFILTVVGCSLFPQEQLEGWKGFHREDLLRAMGPPTQETSLPNGGQRLEYIQRITRYPSASQLYGQSHECHKIFELDSEGTIQAVSETGC